MLSALTLGFKPTRKKEAKKREKEENHTRCPELTCTRPQDAGSQFTLLFQEDNSQISAVTAPFPVYGQTLQLDSAAQNAIQAGESLLDVSVRVLGSTSQTLTSIEASDSFTVTVRASKP